MRDRLFETHDYRSSSDDSLSAFYKKFERLWKKPSANALTYHALDSAEVPPEIKEHISKIRDLEVRFNAIFLPSPDQEDRAVIPLPTSGEADEQGDTDQQSRHWGSRMRHTYDVFQNIYEAGLLKDKFSMLLGVTTTLANFFYAYCMDDNTKKALTTDISDLGGLVKKMFHQVYTLDSANDKYGLEVRSFAALALRVLIKDKNLEKLSEIVEFTYDTETGPFLDYLTGLPESIEAPYYDRRDRLQELFRKCLKALCHQVKVTTKTDLPGKIKNLYYIFGFDRLPTENEFLLYVKPDAFVVNNERLWYWNLSTTSKDRICDILRVELSLPSGDTVSYPKRETPPLKGRKLDFEGGEGSNALEMLIQDTFPDATISFDLGTLGAITVSYEKTNDRYKITNFIINETEMVSNPVILEVTELKDFVTRIILEYSKPQDEE